MNLQESIRKILKEEFTEDKNLYGEKLKPCSTKPMTGYYRDGYCRTGDDDTGSHTVCARVTEEFLEFTNSKGNNLDMLEPGDKWCLCAKRWEEANKEGMAPEMIKSSTNIRTLDIIGSGKQELDQYSRTLKESIRRGPYENIPPQVKRRLPDFDEAFIHYRNFFQNYFHRQFDHFWDSLMERVLESLYHEWFVNSVSEDKWDDSEQFIQDYLTEKYYEDTKKWWDKNK